MTGLLAPQVPFRYTDNNGNPLVGGKVWTYINQTTTLQTTYNNAALTSANLNPIILNSRGECDIYLPAGKAFTFKITDSLDNVLKTVDGIYGSSPAGSGGWIDVKAYGAVGNGTTDDTAAIQAAVNAARSLGLTLYFPAGTYKTTSSISVSGYIHMLGDVVLSSIISFTQSNQSHFVWTGDMDYSLIENITFQGPGSPTLGQTGIGIESYHGSSTKHVVFNQCLIQDYPLYGVFITDSYNCKFNNTNFYRNGVRAALATSDTYGETNAQGAGIGLGNVTFSSASSTGNVYDNCYFAQNNIGVKNIRTSTIARVYNSSFIGCIFEFNFTGIDLRSTNATNPGNSNILSGCYFEQNLYAGSFLESAAFYGGFLYNTTAVGTTGLPPDTSLQGPDGINFTSRFVRNTNAQFRVGNYENNADIQNILSINKLSTGGYVDNLVVSQTGAIKLIVDAGNYASDPTNVATIHAGAGNPEGSRTANSGSLYLNKSGSGASDLLYVKSTDSTNTGWVNFGSLFGPTASRPTPALSNKGQHYYDTDTLRVVTSNGIDVWREYNGLTTVKDTYANIPTGIEGAQFWASDLNTGFIYDGGIWRSQFYTPTFGGTTNAGSVTMPNRGGVFIGTTTGAVVATFSLVLPAAANSVSGDSCKFSMSNGVTTLTVSAGAGASVVNAPTTMTAGQRIEFIYNTGTTSWYKV
ncbi:MAG: glycosyl hydrolase family 28-related protein [Steroidobacteraceae bacterium]